MTTTCPYCTEHLPLHAEAVHESRLCLSVLRSHGRYALETLQRYWDTEATEQQRLWHRLRALEVARA